MENYQVADADTPLPTLVGPGNFCVAIRNTAVAAAIADELNRLVAEVERLREAVLMAYRKGHHHTVNGGYQWCDQGGREVVEEIISEAQEEE